MVKSYNFCRTAACNGTANSKGADIPTIEVPTVVYPTGATR